VGGFQFEEQFEAGFGLEVSIHVELKSLAPLSMDTKHGGWEKTGFIIPVTDLGQINALRVISRTSVM